MVGISDDICMNKLRFFLIANVTDSHRSQVFRLWRRNLGAPLPKHSKTTAWITSLLAIITYVVAIYWRNQQYES
jgi:hypothetical protein